MHGEERKEGKDFGKRECLTWKMDRGSGKKGEKREDSGKKGKIGTQEEDEPFHMEQGPSGGHSVRLQPAEVGSTA